MAKGAWPMLLFDLEWVLVRIAFRLKGVSRGIGWIRFSHGLEQGVQGTRQLSLSFSNQVRERGLQCRAEPCKKIRESR